MILSNSIVNIDALSGLKLLSDNSIDFSVQSPPYDSLRYYEESRQEGWHWDYFEVIATELKRVLKDGGAIAWIVGDQMINGSESLTSFKQAIYFKEKLDLNVDDTMIYQKKNFSNPSKNRYHQVFEYIFIITKGKLKTFNPIKDRPNISAGKIGSLGANTVTQKDGSKLARPRKINAEFGMRHNVWLGNTRGQEEMCSKLDHPAMMPKWLARDLIISYSNPGDLVLDIFSGSGTICGEAKKLNRNYLGFEINKNYCKLAKNYVKSC